MIANIVLLWLAVGTELQAGGFALHGDVATPDTVIRQGVVVVSDSGTISCVGAECALPEGYAVIETSGVILPGLVDPHNHVSWNVHKVPAWTPEHKSYANRYQWQGKEKAHPDAEQSYKKFFQFHMSLEKAGPDTVNALHYYSEIMALLGGVTTLEGGSGGYGGGLVHHPETLVGSPPPRVCATVFPLWDFDPSHDKGNPFPAYLRNCFLKDAPSGRASRLIIHLAEGLPTDALTQDEYGQFAAYYSTAGIPSGVLTVIHGVGLSSSALDDLGARGEYLVWSPRSNITLYDHTLNPAEVRAHGVKVTLGADWSLSGSKTQLQEIAYARRYLSDNKISLAGLGSSNERELAIMATAGAAEAVGMGGRVGKLAPGYLADILVLRSTATQDPYSTLATASERDVALVLVGGEALYGDKELVLHEGLGTPASACEPITVCGSEAKLLCVRRTNHSDPIRIDLSKDDVVRLLTSPGKIPADQLAPLADEACR